MFERYTEKARRVIFFARYEASNFGSPHIETEHLLLGLLREDKALSNRFLRSGAAVDTIRKQIEAHTTRRDKISTSVDLPLSHESKRVLAYGAEEAERLRHEYIETMHLLLGLLREERGFAAELLRERGLSLALVRQEVASMKPPGDVGSSTTAQTANPEIGVYDPIRAKELQTAIAAYIAERGQEWKVSAVLDFPVSTGSRRVVTADVAILQEEAPDAVSPAPPLVCVEILTLDKGFRETQRRIDDYLAVGVRYVWLLDPATKRAYAATSETGLRELKDSALRTENPVLEIPLAEIFS
ncbi:MAG TPA: Clp protease N-terminal domain-containing protein [Bryobacteraceae bacterium]|nr:Clp protease N-terminal domain-containing protein [Bryobacteraceae bacterium]